MSFTILAHRKHGDIARAEELETDDAKERELRADRPPRRSMAGSAV
jgi:hypothetical protein